VKTLLRRLVWSCTALIGLTPLAHAAGAPATESVIASSFTPLSVTVIGKNTYMVRDALTMTFRDGTPSIVVPAGFTTDLGSVPKRLRWWEGGSDASIAPAIVHDYLYWYQPCTQAEADAVLYTALDRLKVGPARNPTGWRVTTYKALGSAAAGAFKKNGAGRGNGERRTVTADYANRLLQSPFEPDETLASALQKAQSTSGLVQQESASPAIKLTCARVLEKCQPCRNDATTRKRR